MLFRHHPRMSEPVDAGSFIEWLQAMRAVLRGEQAADVPCGDCVGCCISSYPIPLRPSDRAAIDRVPAEHLHLPADGRGLARMGFRADGSCPMLVAGSCSIYAHRPQTCRDYDCRIYAAAGIEPDGDRPVIRSRVLAWRFRMASSQDRLAADAVARAAAFIRAHSHLFPAAMRAGSATAVAVLAVKTFELFLDSSRTSDGEQSSEQAVHSVIGAARAFDQQVTGVECVAGSAVSVIALET